MENSLMQRNAIELQKIVNSKVEIGRQCLLIICKRPVVVKAKIEKLIGENKINSGFITQLDSAVIYEPHNQINKTFKL